jgi:hypothetical protein
MNDNQINAVFVGFLLLVTGASVWMSAHTDSMSNHEESEQTVKASYPLMTSGIFIILLAIYAIK